MGKGGFQITVRGVYLVMLNYKRSGAEASGVLLESKMVSPER